MLNIIYNLYFVVRALDKVSNKSSFLAVWYLCSRCDTHEITEDLSLGCLLWFIGVGMQVDLEIYHCRTVSRTRFDVSVDRLDN